MHRVGIALLAVTGCGFDVTGAAPGDGGADAASDARTDAAIDAAMVTPCSTQAGLLLCLSFDAPAFGATMANEGSAQIAAELANVTRIARGDGGAAMLGTTSQIRIPTNTVITGVASFEAWIYLDENPPSGGRFGIADAESSPSAISVFYYNNVNGDQLRFELGSQVYIEHTLALDAWHHIAHVCSGNMLTGYVDGVSIGSVAGCTPGAGTTNGLQLGQNNTGTGGDQGIVGAIDDIRAWTIALTPVQICAHAGRPGC